MRTLLMLHINRDTLIAFALGMFFTAGLYSYIFAMEQRRKEAMRWLRQRVAGR
jgi:hypothetical protein